MRRIAVSLLLLALPVVVQAEDCNYLKLAEVTCVSLAPAKLRSLMGLNEAQVRDILLSEGRQEGDMIHFNGMAAGKGSFSGGLNITFTNGISDIVSAVITKDNGAEGGDLQFLKFIQNSRTGFFCFDGDPKNAC